MSRQKGWEFVNASAQSLTSGESPIRGSAAFRKALLLWYDQFGRDLPWRVKGGGGGDPYRVWLSEVMLQQTTVAAVTGYFDRFTTLWPTLRDLARADDAAVMQAWAGLGYYSRARNLIAAARLLDERGWPADEAGLRALPGVGAYTAAAIASIAFGQVATVVDANVERVMARLFAVQAPLPGAKAQLYAHAQSLQAHRRPGDYAQALMDLGATVCTPRAPQCGVCPVARFCQAHAQGVAHALPRKAAKAARPTRYGVAFLLIQGDQGLVFWRPPQGLLGGMPALPSTPWRDTPWTVEDAAAHAPAAAAWREAGAVRHVFTHFALDLAVWTAHGRAEGEWRALADLERGMPTVFKKAARRALAQEA